MNTDIFQKSLLMAFLLLILVGCDKNEKPEDEIPVLPLTGNLNIFIEWSTDPARFGEGGPRWWGKADILVNITGLHEVADGFFTLDGTGSGNQYACDVFIPSPCWLESVTATPFTVEIETGTFTSGLGYAVSMYTENALFSYTKSCDNGTHYTDEPDELMHIINGSMILSLPMEYNYVCSLYDTTILGTAYHVVASFD
ncbi:MAG: hypothetical protein JXB00_12485 [Bacteroidales bacterium]|nr:hypothetical protein [Bacteroidales bacterium]